MAHDPKCTVQTRLAALENFATEIRREISAVQLKEGKPGVHGCDGARRLKGDPAKRGDWKDLYDKLASFGFSVDGADMSIGPDYIEDMLRRHGPFMIFIDVVDFPFYGPMCVNVGSGFHAVVINGINTAFWQGDDRESLGHANTARSDFPADCVFRGM